MKWLLSIFFTGIFHVALAQLPGNFNLVPNPSFEFNGAQYGYGSNPFSDTSFANSRMCWIAPTNNGNPIMNPLFRQNESENLRTDATHFKAHTGVCAGMFNESLSDNGYSLRFNEWEYEDTFIDERSFQQTRLLLPLMAGVTYYFTMYVGEYKSTDSTLIYDDVLGNIGVYFSVDKINNYHYTNLNGTQGGLHVIPQIRFVNWDVQLLDTCMYTKLTATYTATGGEQYMTIGNFDFFTEQHFVYVSPGDTAVQVAYPSPIYPFVDDISLVSDTTQAMISLSEFSLGNDTVLCPGQSRTLGGQPNFFHYWWSTGDTTRFITVNQPGTYWCKVDYGCSTYTDTINLLPAIPVSFHIPDTALCPGQQYTVSASPGYTHYLWSNGDTTLTVTLSDTGTYWLQIASNCGTSLTDTFHITGRNSAPVLPFAIPDTTLCPGQSYVANGPAGYPYYLWSTSATTPSIPVSGPGTYWLQVNNDCGASYTDTFRVFSGITSVDLGNDTLICNGAQSYTLSVPRALSGILWSTGSTASTITVVQPGTYSVQVQSVCGSFADTVQVNFCSPVIDKIISTDTICKGECITVSADTHNYPQNFSWSFAGTVLSSFSGPVPPQVCYPDTGTYAIELVVSNAGGTDSRTNNIVVLPKPDPAFTDTTITVAYKTSLTLPACANAIHIQWFFNDSLVCNDCSTYTFTAENYLSAYQCIVSNAGCTETCNYKIMVTGIPTDVWMPTAFTPNGDGLNDYFHAITDNPNISALSLSVYNRYGQKIYEGVQDSKGWDGTFGGVPVEEGTYFWYMRYKVLGTDMTYNKQGDVTVVR